MAQIVLGMATSHGPMLSTPWQQWAARVPFDKQLKEHHFQGGKYSFDELVLLRRGEHLAGQITQERWHERSQACEAALEKLAAKFAAVKPDVAVIIGNDQQELFDFDNFPAFCVYWGETIESGPRSQQQIANLPPGVAIAERGFAPPDERIYPAG